MTCSPTTGAFTIAYGDPEDPGALALLRESESYARQLYPAESVHMLPVAELCAPHVRFLVARSAENGGVVGCGALVRHGTDGELKRMFVAHDARRRGIGRALLRALELEARSEGIDTIRLETGVNQPEALELYRRCGYKDRGPFGEYRDDPLSVFMEKRLE